MPAATLTATMTTSPLFEPIQIMPSLSLPNRIVMAPMTRNKSPGNVPNDDVVEYYRKRAAGGVGFIITEGTFVNHPGANGYPQVPAFYGTDALAAWRRVLRAVHDEGGKIAPQLWHVGSIRRPGTEPDPVVPGYGPSEIKDEKTGEVVVRAMSKEDIYDVIRAFVDAAVAAQQIGMDAIEIHGAHGYLIDQFFWSGSNKRTDEYGADPKLPSDSTEAVVQRTRFAAELIAAVRAAVGPDFPIILRFSQWKQQDYEARLVKNSSQLAAFLKPLSDAGVDIFHCSTRRFWLPEFPEEDPSLNLAGWSKKLSGKPTITVGNVGLSDGGDVISTISGTGPEVIKADGIGSTNLSKRVAAGEFDLVAVGRALISDAEWANKIKMGEFEALKPFSRADLAVYPA